MHLFLSRVRCSSDHSSSPIQRRRNDLYSQCGGDLEINDELDVIVCFDWNLTRICTFYNLVHQARRLAPRFVKIRTVTGEPALFYVPRTKKHRRYPLPGGSVYGKTGNVE